MAIPEDLRTPGKYPEPSINSFAFLKSYHVETRKVDSGADLLEDFGASEEVQDSLAVLYFGEFVRHLRYLEFYLRL
jgi:hypothetical protein